MTFLRSLIYFLVVNLILLPPAFSDRLKDLTSLAGVRSNQLVGRYCCGFGGHWRW